MELPVRADRGRFQPDRTPGVEDRMDLEMRQWPGRRTHGKRKRMERMFAVWGAKEKDGDGASEKRTITLLKWHLRTELEG